MIGKRLCRSWRKVPLLLIILAAGIIISKRYPHKLDKAKLAVDRPILEIVKNGNLNLVTERGFTYNQYNNNGTSLNLNSEFVGFNKCPACLGVDMCDHIKRGFVSISSNMHSQRGIYYGKLHNEPIVVHKSIDRWKQFEESICQNSPTVSKTTICDVSKVIMFTVNEFMIKLSHSELDYSYAFHSTGFAKPAKISFMMCAHNDVLQQMTEHLNLKKNWSNVTLANFYTAMLVNPEAILLKVKDMVQMYYPFPRLLGTCGQLVILQYEAAPLETYLSSPWRTRSDLALQILNIIDSFIKSSKEWFLYTDFQYENLEVTSEGRLIISDISGLMILSKNIARESETTAGKPCNEDCFMEYMKPLLSDHLKTCESAMDIMDEVMYANVCKHILSDLQQHRSIDEEEADGPAPGPRGLLHTPPKNIAKKVESIMTECVEESGYGSRVDVIEELKNILITYLKVEKSDNEI